MSTSVPNNVSPEYDYIDTTFVERQTASNLEVDTTGNEIRVTSCLAYRIHNLPGTTGEKNYEIIN